MPQPNLFLIFLNPLQNAGILYTVTGSVACVVYGEPRLTHDIDLIIHLASQDILKFMQAFPAKQFYIPPEDIIRIEKSRDERGHINLIHHDTGFKADIYFTGKDELSLWAIKNSRIVEYHNNFINIAPPEYVIIRKLEYYREGKMQKHLLDIQGILRNPDVQLNFRWLNQKIRKYDLQKEWEKIKKELRAEN